MVRSAEEDGLAKWIKSNGFVSAGRISIPDQSDPVEGRYKTLVKYGNLTEYAMSENPIKNSIFYTSWVLRMREVKNALWTGGSAKFLTMDNVVSNAQTIAIPMWIEL